jgi:hypothetical protein
MIHKFNNDTHYTLSLIVLLIFFFSRRFWFSFSLYAMSFCFSFICVYSCSFVHKVATDMVTDMVVV